MLSRKETVWVLCDDLEGWDGEGRGGMLKQEGIYMYLQLIHSVVLHKLNTTL